MNPSDKAGILPGFPWTPPGRCKTRSALCFHGGTGHIGVVPHRHTEISDKSAKVVNLRETK